jgi:trans-aconitate methyltransferase
MLQDILSVAPLYRLFGRISGATRGRRVYVQSYIRPKSGDRVLDIGCGPGDILEALPDVVYYGFDSNAEYIEAARRRFGARATFDVAMVNPNLVKQYEGFDLVLATGVLHHLNDADADTLFHISQTALKPGGVLITLDGCFVPEQSRVARALLKRDRGQFVRAPDEYTRLAATVFSQVEAHVCHDLLRIPYTHLIMRCTKS